MVERDNGGRRGGSKHTVLNALRRNLGTYTLDGPDRTAPARYDVADDAEDDYRRFARRGE